MRDAVPTISLHRAGGGSFILGAAGSGAPVRLGRAPMGLGVAPTSFSTSPRLAGHGSVLRGKRLDERSVMVPVMLSAGSMSGLNAVREELVRFLSPLDERELTLRVDVPGRDLWREIPADYAGGLEGDYDDAYHGTWEKRVIEFKVAEALWRGEPVQATKRTDAATKPFLSLTEPFFPATLADSTVAGRMVVNVKGDAPTYPVWTITPPGSDLLIRNRVTGEEFYLNGLLTEPIHLDMSDGHLWSASDPDGTELWKRVPAERGRLFELAPGRNELEFSLVGATDASVVHVTYSPRYLAGY